MFSSYCKTNNNQLIDKTAAAAGHMPVSSRVIQYTVIEYGDGTRTGCCFVVVEKF